LFLNKLKIKNKTIIIIVDNYLVIFLAIALTDVNFWNNFILL